MTYPTLERERAIEEEKKSRETKEYELYIDCSSFEEFEVKRAILGISYKNVFLDKLKWHYLYIDKCSWLKDSEMIKVLFPILAAGATVLPFVMKSIILSMIPLCMFLAFTVYLTTCAASSEAQSKLDFIKRKREDADRAAHLNQILNKGTSSVNSVFATSPNGTCVPSANLTSSLFSNSSNAPLSC